MVNHYQDDEESSIEEDLELLDQLNIHYDFSAWETFRESLSVEKRAMVRTSVRKASLLVPFRSNSVVASPSDIGTSCKSTSTVLTEEESVEDESEEEEENRASSNSGDEASPILNAWQSFRKSNFVRRLTEEQSVQTEESDEERVGVSSVEPILEENVPSDEPTPVNENNKSEEIVTKKMEVPRKAASAKRDARLHGSNFASSTTSLSTVSTAASSSTVSSSTELTEDERADIDKWKMRFMTAFGSVFDKGYVPKRWEQKEMDGIIDFLALKNPDTHPEYLKDDTTKKAIRSIFFPESKDPKSILLKRGPVLVGGEDERELMLFTNGFVLSRIELGTLVNLLLDGNDGSAAVDEDLTSEQIRERFNAIDTDGSGSLNRFKLNEMFLGLGMVLSEETLDSIMDTFDANRDGTIGLYDFMFHSMKEIEPKQDSRPSDVRSASSASWGAVLANELDEPQQSKPRGERLTWGAMPASEPRPSKPSKDRFTWGSMRPTFKKALRKSSIKVTRKLDVAFRMSDIDKIENIGECYGKEFDSECAKITFAIYLKGVETPLVMTCSKPGHVKAWMDAFRTCIKSLKSQCPPPRSFRNSNPLTMSHAGLIHGLPEELVPKDEGKKGYGKMGSRLDWGDDSFSSTHDQEAIEWEDFIKGR